MALRRARLASRLVAALLLHQLPLVAHCGEHWVKFPDLPPAQDGPLKKAPPKAPSEAPPEAPPVGDNGERRSVAAVDPANDPNCDYRTGEGCRGRVRKVISSYAKKSPDELAAEISELRKSGTRKKRLEVLQRHHAAREEL